MNKADMGLHVINPGLSATVQDSGRSGYRRHGLAPGGAMDLHAFNWANKLLENPGGSACLEIMIGGFEARAETDLVIAVTGADATVRINGTEVGQWQTLTLNAGDVLGIGVARSGRFLYLALPGGIDGQPWLDSQTVVPREHIEGLAPLAAGERLVARSPLSQSHHQCHREVPVSFRPDYCQDLTLAVIPGYQIELFSKNDLVRLTTQDYELTQQSDRMGYRLSGPRLEDTPAGIISEGIAVGAMQIPGDGQPIVLLNDGQTIGGYPKPGVVASLDRHKLAQRLPGQKVRFAFKNLSEAQNERRLFNLYFLNTRWEKSGSELKWR